MDYLQRRLLHPAQNAQQQAKYLEQLGLRLFLARPGIVQYHAQQAALVRRLQSAMLRTQETLGMRWRNLQQHLLHLDPDQVLARGYSMVRDERGKLIRNSAALTVGTQLNITFTQGWARVEVKEKGAAKLPREIAKMGKQ